MEAGGERQHCWVCRCVFRCLSLSYYPKYPVYACVSVWCNCARFFADSSTRMAGPGTKQHSNLPILKMYHKLMCPLFNPRNSATARSSFISIGQVGDEEAVLDQVVDLAEAFVEYLKEENLVNTLLYQCYKKT